MLRESDAVPMKGGLSTTEQNRDEREAAAKDEGRTDLSAGDVEPLKASGFSFFSSCFFFSAFPFSPNNFHLDCN